MSRATRSGKTFSPYELGHAIVLDVDVADLLRARIAELDAEGDAGSVEDDDLEANGAESPVSRDAPSSMISTYNYGCTFSVLHGFQHTGVPA